jgi:NAD(P)H-dependent FMN reductase
MSAPPRLLITIISGTNRPGHRARAVAEQVRHIYHEKECEVWLIDLAAFAEGTFDPSVEPPGFKEVADLFVAAKGLVIITPEENGEIPNILKYFFAWIRGRVSLQVRPVAFVGLSDAVRGGAEGPVDQLHEMFGARKNGYIYPVRMLIHDAVHRVHEDGTLDELDHRKLEKHAEGFMGFCDRMKGTMNKF